MIKNSVAKDAPMCIAGLRAVAIKEPNLSRFLTVSEQAPVTPLVSEAELDVVQVRETKASPSKQDSSLTSEPASRAPHR